MAPRAAKVYPSQAPLIMVVDDLDVNRKIRCAVLRSAGYRVLEAKEGAEALRLASASPPNLILSDILMPVMDGFELCRAWKADSRLSAIPFVFYSATYTAKQDQEFALRLGADAFLGKGADNAVFLREIGRLIEAPRRGPKQPQNDVRDEGAFYREHSERVVHKLEDKLHELERANTDIKAREKELREAKADLEQRVGARTAELLAMNKELESFAYTVSHDLRAPLRMIGAMSAGIRDKFGDEAPPWLNDDIEGINRAVRRMSTLMDALLELSRVARRVLKRERIDVSALARDVVAELLHGSSRVPEVEVQPDLTVVADRQLMRIVLSNLFDNALKYTGQEQEARVVFGSRVEQGETVFFVSDNGVGFEQHEVGALFKPFQRLHSDEDFSGTGIGLATVARIIQRHGGGVWAEGARDEGATFFFSVPRV